LAAPEKERVKTIRIAITFTQQEFARLNRALLNAISHSNLQITTLPDAWAAKALSDRDALLSAYNKLIESHK
jgi:hypothetical protein